MGKTRQRGIMDEYATLILNMLSIWSPNMYKYAHQLAMSLALVREPSFLSPAVGNARFMVSQGYENT